jgi:hypothetical protein
MGVAGSLCIALTRCASTLPERSLDDPDCMVDRRPRRSSGPGRQADATDYAPSDLERTEYKPII